MWKFLCIASFAQALAMPVAIESSARSPPARSSRQERALIQLHTRALQNELNRQPAPTLETPLTGRMRAKQLRIEIPDYMNNCYKHPHDLTQPSSDESDLKWSPLASSGHHDCIKSQDVEPRGAVFFGEDFDLAQADLAQIKKRSELKHLDKNQRKNERKRVSSRKIHVGAGEDDMTVQRNSRRHIRRGSDVDDSDLGYPKSWFVQRCARYAKIANGDRADGASRSKSWKYRFGIGWVWA